MLTETNSGRQDVIDAVTVDEFGLTWKERLGFDFEVDNYHAITSFLTTTYFELIHNPLDPQEWKSNNCGKRDDGFNNCDKMLTIHGITFYIEEKYVRVRQYLSWIKRHYVPRFKYARKGYRVVLTNDKSKFSKKCRDELKKYHILLMTMDELFQYLEIIIGMKRERCTTICINQLEIISNKIVTILKHVSKFFSLYGIRRGIVRLSSRLSYLYVDTTHLVSPSNIPKTESYTTNESNDYDYNFQEVKMNMDKQENEEKEVYPELILHALDHYLLKTSYATFYRLIPLVIELIKESEYYPDDVLVQRIERKLGVTTFTAKEYMAKLRVLEYLFLYRDALEQEKKQKNGQKD